MGNLTVVDTVVEGIQCVLCGKIQGLNKKGNKEMFPKHHISYAKDISIQLCFVCHQAVHCRLRWKSPWESKYGKDKAFYELAKRFVVIYEESMWKVERVKGGVNVTPIS